MKIKILIDMNLSPDWVAILQRHGVSAVHWSTVGNPRDTDRAVMDWAIANEFVVFTHDLDFGTVLALTHGTGPSVIQVRTGDVLATDLEQRVVSAIMQNESELTLGALVVIDAHKSRVRILPL